MVGALNEIGQYGVSFIVAGRLLDGSFQEASPDLIPASLIESESTDGQMFQFLTETEFRNDISST